MPPSAVFARSSRPRFGGLVFSGALLVGCFASPAFGAPSLADLLLQLDAPAHAEREEATALLSSPAHGRALYDAFSDGSLDASKLSPEQRSRVSSSLRTWVHTSPRGSLGVAFEKKTLTTTNAMMMQREFSSFSNKISLSFQAGSGAGGLQAGDVVTSIAGVQLPHADEVLAHQEGKAGPAENDLWSMSTSPPPALTPDAHSLTACIAASYCPSETIDVTFIRDGAAQAAQIPLISVSARPNAQENMLADTALDYAWRKLQSRFGLQDSPSPAPLRAPPLPSASIAPHEPRTSPLTVWPAATPMPTAAYTLYMPPAAAHESASIVAAWSLLHATKQERPASIRKDLHAILTPASQRRTDTATPGMFFGDTSAAPAKPATLSTLLSDSSWSFSFRLLTTPQMRHALHAAIADAAQAVPAPSPSGASDGS